jgi:hypothetical protein
MNRFMSRLQKAHTIDVIKHILRYVKRYVDCRILYKKGDKNLIEGFVKSNWVNDQDCR